MLSLTSLHPFTEPEQLREGVVSTGGGSLNIRSTPSENAAVIGKVPNGAFVTITGEDGNWYAIQYSGIAGFVQRRFVNVE